MDRKEVLMRIGGIVLALSGLILIMISGKLVSTIDVGLADKAAEFILRAGFGVMLLGLLTLFLFSFRTVPKELVDPLLIGQDRNIGRLLDSLELKGKGIYIPAGGRLVVALSSNRSFRTAHGGDADFEACPGSGGSPTVWLIDRE